MEPRHMVSHVSSCIFDHCVEQLLYLGEIDILVCLALSLLNVIMKLLTDSF